MKACLLKAKTRLEVSQCPSLRTIACWLQKIQIKQPENKSRFNPDLCVFVCWGMQPNIKWFQGKMHLSLFIHWAALKNKSEYILLIFFTVITPWQMPKLNSWYTFQIFIALQHAQPLSSVSDRLHPAVMCVPLKNSLSSPEFMLVRAN